MQEQTKHNDIHDATQEPKDVPACGCGHVHSHGSCDHEHAQDHGHEQRCGHLGERTNIDTESEDGDVMVRVQTGNSGAVPVIKQTWLLEGLDCPDCAARVENVVSKIPGVARAVIGFPSGVLKAEYRLGETDPEAILASVKRLGYQVKAGPGVRTGLVRSSGGEHSLEHDHDHVYDGHDHSDEHGQRHAHDGHAGHAHSHADFAHLGHSHGHSHGHGGSLAAPLIGAVGIAFGMIAEHMGVTWYWIPFLAAATVAGFPVAKAGIVAFLAGGGADINLLTTIAGIGALFLGQWAEAAEVLTLFSIGEFLEKKASERARKSISDLMDLSPSTARVRKGNATVEVESHDVVPGDILAVFPGEKIPADGTVQEGESGVNEAPITGESIPVDKHPGDEVFAGSINGEGPLEIRATRTAEDTTVARIVAMVEEAQSRKAKSQRLVDIFAKYWTPSMIGLSLLVAVGVPLLFRLPLKPWIYRGLTVLIVSCPCSFVISTPVTVVAAIARAARFGVLVKGGVHLEDLGRVKAVAFDKTGTITKGRIAVEDVVARAPFSSSDVLSAAAAVESRSEHPLAKAVLVAAGQKGLLFETGEHFATIRGKGAKARVAGRTVYVGSERLMEETGIEIPGDLTQMAAEMRHKGQTAVYVGAGHEVLGVMALADEVRQESKKAIDRLYELGLHVVMLTGDEEATAKAVASKTGLRSFCAGLLPGDKQQAIAALKQEYGTVAMVGDGVNDAPSLAAATVGIAMGAGADVALETADVALLKNDLGKVPWSLGLGRAARSLIVQNVGFSMLIKAVALFLVMLGLLPLWAAVLADSGAAVLVTLNGLRVLSYR